MLQHCCPHIKPRLLWRAYLNILTFNYTSFIVHIAYYVQMCSLMQALQKAGNFCKQAVPNEHQTASSASPHYTLSPPPAQKKNCAEKCKLRREKILRDNRIIIKSFPVAPREQWNCWPHKRREAEKLQKKWNCSSSSKLFGGIWRLSLPGIVTTPKIVTIVPSVPENKLDEIIAEVHATVNIIWMH